MLAKIQERIESLTTREKAIFFITLLALFGSIWDSLIYSPLTVKQRALDQQLHNLNAQIFNLQHSVSELEKAAKTDPNAENISKLSELKAQYSRLQAQIMFGNKKFVPPDLMAKALGDMLNQNNHLTLVKLETLPADTLLKSEGQYQPIYKHGLVITFTGTYNDTVDYLEALEALPWALAWDRLDYQVKNYPLAEITLHTYTLSFEKRWLGV